ncbi:polysaccharide lyase, partial [Candidatus Kaiserbacteria bacterium]|nr:polysaccharide lyase [Candidatus Kaiserbacteria bacterium]
YQKNYPDRTKNISVNKTGRYIRVQLEDKQILHMSEVEVYGELAGQSNQVTTVESKSVDTQTSNSTTFKTGQTVKVNTGDGSKLNVRSSANGTAVGKQADGSVGKITSGPTDKAGYTWWKVNFDSGSDGWAVEKYLKKHTVSATTASTPVTTTSKPVSNGTAKLLFLGDFETGGIQAADKYHDGWGQQLNNNPSKVTTEQVRAGKYAWKTDFNRISSYYGSNKPRSELMKTKPNMMSLDTEYWIGLSVYIPKDWKADSVHEILWQMHGADGASPPLDFRTFDDKMYLVHRYESNGKNNTDTIWQSSIERGKWIDFIINVKWSGKEDGFLNIWKNENKIYSLKGDVGFGLNGSGHTFLKIGDYKWRWFTSPTSVTRRVLYHDEIRIAEGSGGYDLVNPGSY